MGVIGYSTLVYESHVENLGDGVQHRIFPGVASVGEDYDQGFERGGGLWARGVCVARTRGGSRVVNYSYSGGVDMDYGVGDRVARE